MAEQAWIGIDLGTSGCRAIAIDAGGAVLAEAGVAMPVPARPQPGHSEQDPAVWWAATRAVLEAIRSRLPPASVAAIAVDGTSGTLLLCDEAGNPLGPALMYDDTRCTKEAARIAAVAPAGTAAHGAGSALARLLHLQERHARARFALHQADWIAGRLTGRFGLSDENNALKLGYDPITRRWPGWLARCGAKTQLLPEVLAPGTPIGPLRNAEVLGLGYRASLGIVAGTTDGVAAFLAAGASRPGDAVTSLGSTLVLKILSTTPVFVPAHGIYSHACGDLWLAGGASNTGGATLASHFTVPEIEALSERIDPDTPTGLDYYPLVRPGERFPRLDPALPPRLEPRPPADHRFLQGLFEGMARIEAEGYALLARHGAPAPARVMTAGAGARNRAWTRIRERALGRDITPACSEQAARGAALLAAGLGPGRSRAEP